MSGRKSRRCTAAWNRSPPPAPVRSPLPSRSTGSCRGGPSRRLCNTTRPLSVPRMGFLIVFLGGGLGAALRHGVNLTSARLLGTTFPYATLFENVTGSLVMGLLAGYFAFKGDASQSWRLFLTTGILGGYTTCSAFSLDTALLYE